MKLQKKGEDMRKFVNHVLLNWLGGGGGGGGPTHVIIAICLRFQIPFVKCFLWFKRSGMIWLTMRGNN